MDVMLQRHCSKYIYVIPDGLRELLSDISREVLRSQPENIYSFIADYLDALLITRENARVAAKVVESITEIGVTIADLLLRTGMTREEADKVTIIIQRAFRKHLLEKEEQKRLLEFEGEEEEDIVSNILIEAAIEPERMQEAAIIIQSAYRRFKYREEAQKSLLKGMVDWRVAARSTMRLYRKTGVTYEEANRAATLIKAAYKGYYTRRLMKKLLERSEMVEEESIIPEECYEGVCLESHFEEEQEEEELKSEAETIEQEESKTAALEIMEELIKGVISSESLIEQSASQVETIALQELGVTINDDVNVEIITEVIKSPQEGNITDTSYAEIPDSFMTTIETDTDITTTEEATI